MTKIGEESWKSHYKTAKNEQSFHKKMANGYNIKQLLTLTSNHRRASWNKTPVTSLTFAKVRLCGPDLA